MLEPAVRAQIPEIWALERLLALGGVEASTAFALGLAGGAGFVATTVKGGRKVPARLHVSGWNSFQSDVVGAIDRLGMVGAFDETTNRRAAAAALAATLAEGTPAALWVDGAGLGLGAAVAAGGPLPLVILATGRPDGTIEVVGPGEAPTIVDAATLGAARDAVPSHRNRLLTVRSPTEERAAAVRAGLATMAVGSIGGPRQRTGPDGVRRLARAIDGRGFGDWRTTFDGGWPLLAALVSFSATIRGEQGLLRATQACFERSAAELLAIPALGPVADAHDALAAGWLDAADLALPADLPGLAAARAATTAPDASAAGLTPRLTADELAALCGGAFPIARAELDALLHDLAAAVTRLAVAEHEALELLRSTLRTN